MISACCSMHALAQHSLLGGRVVMTAGMFGLLPDRSQRSARRVNVSSSDGNPGRRSTATISL